MTCYVVVMDAVHQFCGIERAVLRTGIIGHTVTVDRVAHGVDCSGGVIRASNSLVTGSEHIAIGLHAFTNQVWLSAYNHKTFFIEVSCDK